MKLTTQIQNFLKDKGIYEAVDTTLIDELVFNKEICEAMKADIAERGYIINVAGKDKDPYMQHNPSIGIYGNALKNITAISTKLGITVLDRIKLGLESQAEDDALTDLIK